MALKLTITKTIRSIATFLNVAVALLMTLGIWRFVSRDDIYGDSSWLVWLPVAIFMLIGLPLWVTWTLFSPRCSKTQVAFLLLNTFAVLCAIFAAYAHNWMMTAADMPFSWYSVSKLAFITGIPFLANAVAHGLLITKDRGHS